MAKTPRVPVKLKQAAIKATRRCLRVAYKAHIEDADTLGYADALAGRLEGEAYEIVRRRAETYCISTGRGDLVRAAREARMAVTAASAGPVKRPYKRRWKPSPFVAKCLKPGALVTPGQMDHFYAAHFLVGSNLRPGPGLVRALAHAFAKRYEAGKQEAIRNRIPRRRLSDEFGSGSA